MRNLILDPMVVAEDFSVMLHLLRCRPHRDGCPSPTKSPYTSFVRKVWIGVVSVLPQDGCELLSATRGAYVNFLTLAGDEAEYRSKVASALAYYRLELHGFENVRLFTLSDNPAEELISIADELRRDNNPQHVRYGTFHTFERVM
jgi:hypothetical protein